MVLFNSIFAIKQSKHVTYANQTEFSFFATKKGKQILLVDLCVVAGKWKIHRLALLMPSTKSHWRHIYALMSAPFDCPTAITTKGRFWPTWIPDRWLGMVSAKYIDMIYSYCVVLYTLLLVANANPPYGDSDDRMSSHGNFRCSSSPTTPALPPFNPHNI